MRSIRSTYYRITNVGSGSCCIFWSYKSNIALSSISKIFSRLQSWEKDWSYIANYSMHNEWCQKVVTISERTQNFKMTSRNINSGVDRFKGKGQKNLCFLQTLRQMRAPTSQATIEFAPWTILGSSKPSLFKFERKK